MASEKTSKSERKEKKEKKRSESDGISKKSKDGSKKDKKDKKEKLAKAAAAEIEGANLHQVPAADTKNDEAKLEAVEVEAGDGKTKVAAVVPVGALVPFARPLADEKGTKKIMKSVKKAAKHKTLKRGVKEVVKALRKSPAASPANTSFPGIVILAGDISPMDVISHIPVLCEDVNVPYIFVQSRAELGAAGSTKRPTSVVMVTENRQGGKKGLEKVEEGDEEDFAETYKDLVKLVQKEQKQIKFT